MNAFDLFALPLKGTHLIEAGAGTGKTYTLTALFLRLVIEQGTSVEQILVVTYTKAATEELKTRIRQRLLAAKNKLQCKEIDDPLLKTLLEKGVSSRIAMQRIKDALINFDRAAVHTIHGFCQRLLQFYAFETGHLFHSELVQDEAPFIQEAVEDFWRRYIACAPKEIAVEALKKIGGPNRLAQTLRSCSFPHIWILPENKKPVLSAVLPWRRVAKSLQSEWPVVKNKVMELLHYDGLNARNYGSCNYAKHGNGLTPRQVKITNLFMSMDQWTGDYPLFKSFELLSSHKLTLATNKGKTTPTHPFFDRCSLALEQHDRLKVQLEAYLQYLKVHLFHKVRPSVVDKKRRSNVLFFDDLLLLVHRAVTGPHGHILAHAVRSQYSTALVDEFQDTDQLQYEIFYRLFADGDNLLAMIGDPKQAIYSFRGADLFSYLKAAGAVESRATLTQNWRATPELIQAHNTLFGNHPKPFGLAGIGFQRAVAARNVQSKLSPALRLWYLPADAEQMPKRWINTGDAVYQIARAVALEVIRLLEDPENSLAPEAIAILVRSHRQADIMKQALSQKRVPAVLHSSGRIFDAPQAEELERVLIAVASPKDPVLVRAALTSRLFGWDASSFMKIQDGNSQLWQSTWDNFLSYHRVWVQHGFYAMFRHMMMVEGIKKRALAYPEGERYVTNLLHLAELLHQAETTHGLGPDVLIRWLVGKRQSDEIGSDDQQLRLESDARAVRIITMHKSKGLQFEVVFCPYTWAGVRDDRQAALFHDPQKGDRLTLALGPPIPHEITKQARKEALAENLRMLYVALTRARQCCYWVWGRMRGSEVSAPAYLLHGHDVDMNEEGWAEQLRERMAGMEHAEWVQSLKELVDRSGGSIGVTSLPDSDRRIHRPFQDPPVSYSARTFTRHFERDWRIASFSTLTSGKPDHGDGSVGADARDTGAKSGLTLFDFHKGARAGLFFHDLLEHWDHTDKGKDRQGPLVSEKLQQHGYEPEWKDAVSGMLLTLSKTVLPGPGKQFALWEVSPDSRHNEMAFHFSLNPVNAKQIQLVFERYGKGPLGREMANQMGRLNFSPTQGFMKGYIDMVFGHRGRYYLLDWKSNFLGSAYADYLPARLEKAMTDAYYFFQYHLYAVALDQLLRQRLSDYDYPSHFGGAFYIFLRGLDSEASGASGIFYDRPSPQLMGALNRLLIATS